MICIKNIVEGAKLTLETTRKHLPQFMGVGDKGMIMATIVMGSDIEKKMAIEFIRGIVKKNSIKKYWIVMEAWKTEMKLGEKIFRRARRDVDRTECLIVTEYNSNMKIISVMIPFKKVDDKFVFEEEHTSTEQHSPWNVYLEAKGINERLEKHIHDVNDAFIKKMSKNLSDKYKDEFFKADTLEKREAVMIRMIKEGKQIIDDQKKTILEDPDN